VPAAPIRERFLKNVFITSILVLTGQQHQYIGAIQREEKCKQHRALFVKRGLFNRLEWSGNVNACFQDGGH
jgi:hypothetical protein